MDLVIQIFLAAFAMYVGVGVLVGGVLAFAGIGRIDPVAAQSPWLFRALVLPGMVGLWPVMLMKWARAGKGGGA